MLCEKPIAITVEEVDQMEAACAKAGVKFMLAWCMRQNVYNKKMRELVQAGALGKMVMGRAQLTCWYPPIPGAWRQDAAISHGGALLDMGTHCLDLLEWIMDSDIVEVTGFQDLLVHKYPTRIEDTSTIVVRFRNGAHGIIDNYFNIPDAAAQNALELFGTKGSIIARGTIGQDPTGQMFSILQAAGDRLQRQPGARHRGQPPGIQAGRHRHLRADDHPVHRLHPAEPPAADLAGRRAAFGEGRGCHLPRAASAASLRWQLNPGPGLAPGLSLALTPGHLPATFATGLGMERFALTIPGNRPQCTP